MLSLEKLLPTRKFRLSRFRYMRGHGVHSPFVYNLCRKAFMPWRKPFEPSDEFMTAASAAGLGHRSVRELYSVMQLMGEQSFSTDCTGGDFVLMTQGLGPQETRKIAAMCQLDAKTAVLVRPYANRERCSLAAELIESHPCTSIDRTSYTLFINRKELPKQKFRL